MIESVKKIVTMKAIDLPPTFDLRIGTRNIPMEVVDTDTYYVYLSHAGETIYIPRDEVLTVLIPDTLDNSRMDIELALLQEGLI